MNFNLDKELIDQLKNKFEWAGEKLTDNDAIIEVIEDYIERGLKEDFNDDSNSK